LLGRNQMKKIEDSINTAVVAMKATEKPFSEN